MLQKVKAKAEGLTSLDESRDAVNTGFIFLRFEVTVDSSMLANVSFEGWRV